MNNSEEKKFTNEIALITGGTQGLGKSIAKLFVQSGIKSIIISGRNETNAKNVINELGFIMNNIRLLENIDADPDLLAFTNGVLENI